MTEILKDSAYERWIVPSIEKEKAAKPVQKEAVAPEIEDVEQEDMPQLPTAEEIETIQQQAHDEGFAAGREQGLQAAEIENQHILDEERAKIETLRQQLESERRELEQARESLRQDAAYMTEILQGMGHPLEELDEVVEEQLLQLTISVARQLIRRELKTEPGEIIGVIREAISVLPVSDNRITIYLHPDDVQMVNETLSLGRGDDRAWHIVEDPLLSRGGCRVVSNDSQVDASVEKRLTAVATKLLGGERGHEQN